MWTNKLKGIEREYQWVGELIWAGVFICAMILAWKMMK